jgi:hypothetical protein
VITASAADFAAALPDGGRLAGLDAGTKTIGLATCDAGWSFASAHSTIARAKFSADLAQLRTFIAAERIKGLVSACRSIWMAAIPRAPNRCGSWRRISLCSICRCCSGTSVGAPRRSSAT